MAKSFDEAFKEALKMTPEDIINEKIDEFAEDAFAMFELMEKFIIMDQQFNDEEKENESSVL